MLRVPTKLDPSIVADWLEASLCVNADLSNYISDADVLEALRESGAGDADSTLASVASKVRYRAAKLGNRYPVIRKEAGFEYVDSGAGDSLPYLFMLFVSLNQLYRELAYSIGTAVGPAEFFESLCAVAAANYLNGKSYRFGAPRRTPLPAAFSGALTFVAGQLGEPIGARDVERQNSGDDGLDIVGWIPFADDRCGAIILLCQCAIGTDWRGKRSDLNPGLWQRHIDWHVEPVRSFAVPFQMDDGGPWRETCAQAGIVFDRIRIAKLASIEEIPDDLAVNLFDWLVTRIAKSYEAASLTA